MPFIQSNAMYSKSYQQSGKKWD